MRSFGNILSAAPRMLVPVVRAYERRLSRYGPTAQGVFWKNQEWQLRRYAILEDIFDDMAQAGGITIHDFGCGYGSLFEYLADKAVMKRSRYIGTDMSQGMIDAAKARHADPRGEFVHGMSAHEIADYTIVSGTYNMHMGADAEEWVEYTQASLKQLWQHTRRGLAFNMLRDDTDVHYAGLYYADPVRFLTFVRESLSPEAEVIFDPPLPDFTIFVRRPMA
jgi:SAM-dependent methyltransferase